MAKKQFWIIVDTESTMKDTCADFGAVVIDRHGVIQDQYGVLIQNHFGSIPLFHNKDSGLWGLEGLKYRTQNYNNMLESGIRVIASVNSVNMWINRVIGKYNPELTAYNLVFDTRICNNTGIDLTGFKSSFCLWQASVGNICKTKPYRQFVLDNHLFNNRTEKGNMSYMTNAECVAGYINGEFITEPHTALEDAIYFELPILKHILKKRDWKDKIKPYGWNDFQVRDNYIPR